MKSIRHSGTGTPRLNLESLNKQKHILLVIHAHQGSIVTNFSSLNCVIVWTEDVELC